METEKIKRPSKVLVRKLQTLKNRKGEIAVIDPESGDYFIAKTLTEALKKAEKKHPHQIFYSIRIGFPFAHEHKGCLQKI
jgi:hypothetical protein